MLTMTFKLKIVFEFSTNFFWNQQQWNFIFYICSLNEFIVILEINYNSYIDESDQRNQLWGNI